VGLGYFSGRGPETSHALRSSVRSLASNIARDASGASRKARLPLTATRCCVGSVRGTAGSYRSAAVEDDRDLLERLRSGNEAAFEELVERHHRSLRRVARTFVRTDAAAEDVVQETWLAVVRGLSGFEGRSSLRTWIFKIMTNLARSHAVRDARNVPFSAFEADEPVVNPAAFGSDGRWISSPPRLDSDPETGLLSGELREHLRNAVDGLPPVQRAVITLRDLVGLGAEEVCDVLDLTDANQRVLLHRARARVRTALLPLVKR
jgi:RNA polymerase sigma-70 factor (ECF subfamily)